ncbi:hypothetical protein FRB90_005727 [Tulasnella sp. 427]|nr:hypothetical protein FRB90_005727 [Tulasnella sp. 427]
MPEPVPMGQPPSGYIDQEGYQTGGFVAPPSAHQFQPPKPNIPTAPNFPAAQPSPQAPKVPISPAVNGPGSTPAQPPPPTPSHLQEPPIKRSGNSFYLKKAQHEGVSKPAGQKEESQGCQCVIC